MNWEIQIKDSRVTILDEFREAGEHKCHYRCKCGNEKVALLRDVIRGQVKSCGCLKAEILRARSMKHGHAPRGKRLGEYWVWQAMIQRCTRYSHKQYPAYGGRGIHVCDRWLHSFEFFLSDMGPCPPGLTLERKENNGNYEPGNCVWASRVAQNNNTRANHRITWEGKTLSVTRWNFELKFPPGCLAKRLWQGWTVERAFTQGAKIV